MKSNAPDCIPYVVPDDADVALPSAENYNKVVAVLNALLNIEVQDYEVHWADGNVVLRKIDKTREGDTQGGVGGVVKCTWAP